MTKKPELIPVFTYENYRLVCQLGSRHGFFQVYYKELGTNTHRTNEEAFNYVNALHFDYFGEYKYSSYNSFRHQLNQDDKARQNERKG